MLTLEVILKCNVLVQFVGGRECNLVLSLQLLLFPASVTILEVANHISSQDVFQLYQKTT